MWQFVHTKKKRVLFFATLFLFALLAVLFFVFRENEIHPAFDAQSDSVPTQSDPVTRIPRQLDGVLVSPKKAAQFPYCVMIENAAFDGVRPQTGLSEAVIVYEIIVEGGITRFMAIFGNELPKNIGPVRSARDNFLDVAAEYNCPYYHAGGSDTAIERIPDLALRSVNGLIEYQYFFRNPLKYAPHDFFITDADLQKAAADHDWHNEAWPDVIQWMHVQEKDVKQFFVDHQSQQAKKITIGFDAGYEVQWVYNTKKRLYERFTAGEKHIDEATGEILTASTVVIQHVKAGKQLPDKGRINWPLIGKGKVMIAHHGRTIEGVWKKQGEQFRTIFVDEEGEQIPFAVGKTWVEIVPPHVEVDYLQ